MVDSRVRGLGRVLGYVMRAFPWDPPLEQVNMRGGRRWNRVSKSPVDAVAWRRAVEAAEARSGPTPRLRTQMTAADAGLVEWIKHHRYLVPATAGAGESGMALLLLWEVDHQQPYPSQGGDGLTGALIGFSRRLQDKVAKDPELAEWLVWRDVHAPLSAGLAPSHHRRWAVRAGGGRPTRLV